MTGAAQGRSLLVALLLAATASCAAPQTPGDRDADVDAPVDAEVDAADAGGWPLSVWAPGADAVGVLVGGRGADATPLEPAGEGVWAGSVPGLDAGELYRFVITRDGQTVERLDPRALAVGDDDRSSVAIAPELEWGDAEAGFVRPSLRDAVIYELHVGTFNATTAWPGGTFASTIERLDHVAALGVTAIELMPVHEFPGQRSWGYNPWHLSSIERAYGGHEDLAALVREAHRRGLAVILDVVYNHMTGPNPLCDFTGGGDGACGAPYFYADERGETDWGPRPDFGADGVRQYLRDNAFQWLLTFHVDGFRVDSTSNIWNTHNGEATDLPEGREFLAWLNGQIGELGDGRLRIAEDFHGGAAVTRQPGEGDGAMGFDAQWDGWFHWEVHRLVAGTDGDLARLAEAMRFRDDDDPFQRIIYTESHDTTGDLNDHVRLPQEIDPADPASWRARKRSTLAAALLMTTPGVPMLLQGQELLQAGAFADDAPLDWSSLERHAGVVRLYTDLIALRRNLAGRTAGLRGPNITVDQVDTARGVIAFRRWDRGGRGDDAVVAANFGERSVDALMLGFPACGAWQVRFDSDRRDYSDDFGGGAPAEVDATSIPFGGLPCSAAIPLAPFSAVVLSQDP